MCKKIWLSIIVLLANVILYADNNVPSTIFAETQNAWVDSVYNSLDENEKLGQLFMVAANADKGQEKIEEVEKLIKEFNIGGVVFFNENPTTQVRLTNRYQSLAKVPLLIAANAQNGLGRDSISIYPRQLTLGAIDEDHSTYKVGKQVASLLKRLGVNMSFSPVVDVNTLDAISSNSERTFGEDIKRVTAKSVSYIKGLRDGKIVPNARLFPSYDDSNQKNYVLPVMTASTQRLQEVMMYPLRQAIKDSVMSIMMGHMYLPSYDKKVNHSSNFSSEVVKDVFRKEFGYEGLIFTDALNIKEINKDAKPGEIDLEALLAGNDVLIFSENIPKAIKKIKTAIKTKDLKAKEIEKSIKKVLEAKYWAGLNNYQPVPLENLYEDLNAPQYDVSNFSSYSKAITLIQNPDSLIPFKALDTLSFSSVSIGTEINNEFQQMLGNYAGVKHYAIPNKYSSDSVFNNVLMKAAASKIVFVSLHGMSSTEGNSYGISPNTLTFIDKLQEVTNVVVVAFGNPFSFKFINKNCAWVCAYEENKYTRQLVPQMLFGAIKAEGVLPVSISSRHRTGFGIKTEALNRLKYNTPESEGLDSKVLQNIDKIVETAIKSNSTPGAQVLVARRGTVVFQKSYGFLTYDSLQPVTNETLFDIASITKVLATVQTLMFLEERGLIDLNKKLSDYLPELKRSNKKDMTLRQVLIHQAGLTPFIPHWYKTVIHEGLNKDYYSTEKSEKYPLEIAKGMYGIKSLPDSIWKWSVDSDLLRKRRRQTTYDYRYSDVGYLFLKAVAEKILNQPMEEFLYQNFYGPLGASTLTYQPLDKFPVQRIAPTEDDKDFRRQLIQGYVHDQGAAMMGGVAGHAGLFGSAKDLAKVFQMNLNNGTYGGQRYFVNTTLPKFTKRQVERNRRGLGWDKPEIVLPGQPSVYTSSATYGHTGFTGTCAWIDPEKDLIYIFLSNRVYPNASNNALLKDGVRDNIQTEIYKAIISFDATNNPQ
ncbi:MAG TPA: glycoside hydrolase family 3 N-terminal domain-containing protein [Cytophagales bacterium]|nr:glycoside hydrolase family 3 N-terminal domain-containing protein [Cytophagales bacterium]